MSWLVVVNPNAGAAPPHRETIRTLLDAQPIDYEMVVTESADQAWLAVDAGVRTGVKRFAVVGGDGSAHLVVNALMQHEWSERPTLAVLPAGSGTDLIRTFALPQTLEEGAARLAHGEAYTMDIGRLELAGGAIRWFLNVVDIGVAAASVSTAQRIPRRVGSVRYPLAFWLTLPRFRPAPVVIRTEKRSLGELALNVVVANGQFFGGGMNIAPQAAISDGLLDIEVFAAPRRNAFTVMPRVMRGLHLRHKAVRSLRSDRFEVEVPSTWPVEADGDLVGWGSVVITAVPAAIDLMI